MAERAFSSMEPIEGIRFYDVKRDGRFSVYGLSAFATEGEFARMRKADAERMNEGIRGLYANTAGGRIRFETDSPVLIFRCAAPDSAMSHGTLILTNGFDVYEEKQYLGSVLPPVGFHGEYQAYCHLDGGKLRSLTVNMPLYGRVDELQIGIKEGSILRPAPPYAHGRPILYYGSSITQGACASRPGTCYQAYISREFDTDYLNFGFSSSALGEEEMAAYLASFEASVFVCDYDHNAPTAEHLQRTHEAFYLAYRRARPDTPVLFLSACDSYFSDRVERRKIVRATYLAARERGEHVLFADSHAALGKDGYRECFVDGLHPNDLGFYRMAKKLIPLLRPLLG